MINMRFVVLLSPQRTALTVLPKQPKAPFHRPKAASHRHLFYFPTRSGDYSTQLYGKIPLRILNSKDKKVLGWGVGSEHDSVPFARAPDYGVTEFVHRTHSVDMYAESEADYYGCFETWRQLARRG